LGVLTMNILVTGGAGYVGSVVAEKLLQYGYGVVILDNLQQGHKDAIPPGARFTLGDIRSAETLDLLFSRFRIDAVMHMAAETVVEYSMTDPKRHFEDNVAGGISLLDTMLKHDVHRFVFSSSAAVYGEPQSIPMREDHPQEPINAYGESKLMFERILDWYGKAYGLKHVCMRYFNAAGASDLLGEDHHPESHLIPNVLKAAMNGGGPVPVFGGDYPTQDGTCVRDYVHVADIAQAHILALEDIDRLAGNVYNLGNSQGYSVMDIIETARKVAKRDIAVRVAPRRPGDPAVLLAGSSRAKGELGWKPGFAEVEAMVETAWKWLRRHPNGYAC
jgi:UDP-glucose 4-epimerase